MTVRVLLYTVVYIVVQHSAWGFCMVLQLCWSRLRISNPTLKCWTLFCLLKFSARHSKSHLEWLKQNYPTPFPLLPGVVHLQPCMIRALQPGKQKPRGHAGQVAWRRLETVASSKRTRGARKRQKTAGSNGSEGSFPHSTRENELAKVICWKVAYDMLKGCLGLKSNHKFVVEKSNKYSYLQS